MDSFVTSKKVVVDIQRKNERRLYRDQATVSAM